MESFNGRLRDELLAAEVFDHVPEARAVTAAWRKDYNEVRPHGSLGYQAPAAFAAAACEHAERGEADSHSGWTIDWGQVS